MVEEAQLGGADKSSHLVEVLSNLLAGVTGGL